MSVIQLGAYTVKVRERRARNFLPLNKFNGTNNIYDLIKKYLQGDARKMITDSNARKVLYVQDVTEGNYITGIIDGGEYGYTSRLVDTNQKLKDYKRKASQAELFPIYYLFDLNTTRDRGILILEKFGYYGIISTFRDILRTNFTNEFGEYIMEIDPLVPTDLMNNYLEKGLVKKLTFTTFTIPKDFANILNPRMLDEKQYESSFVIKARKNSFLQRPSWAKDISKNNGNIQKLFEVNKNIENIKLEVSVGGTRRTINLNQRDLINPYFDVTDKVELKDGHPIFDSLNREAIKLVHEVKKEFLRE